MDSQRRRGIRAVAAVGIGAGCLGIVVACGGVRNQSMTSASGTTVADTALLSIGTEVVSAAATIGPDMQNQWGITVAPGLHFWISDDSPAS